MRVRELSLRNYRVFESVDLELPARVIGVFGVNGSGKTSLVESMLFALYGRARTAKDQIRTNGILTDCEVRMVFEHGGSEYEVRRRIRGKGHQSEAELLVGDLQLAVGVGEVDEEVRRLLRMDQQVFRASVFAEQKQLDAFSDVTKGKRKEMVLRLLGIKPVDDARAAARAESRQKRTDADRLARELPDLTEIEARLAQAREVAVKAREAAGEAARQLEEAGVRLAEARAAFEESDRAREVVERLAAQRAEAQKQAEAAAARRRDLEGRIEGLRRDLAELPALDEEAGALAGAREAMDAGRRWAQAAEDLARVANEAGALPEVDAAGALKELEAATAEVKGSSKAAAKAESALERAQEALAQAQETLERAGDLDPSQPCPTCGQPLGEGFEGYVAHCSEEVARLKDEASTAARTAKGAEAARKKAEARLVRAQKAGTEAQKATSRREHLDREVEKARAKAEELAGPFSGREPDMGDLEARAHRAEEVAARLTELRTEQKHLSQAERDLAAAVEELEGCEARLRDLDREAQAAAFDRGRHRTLTAALEEATAGHEQARADERHAADAVKEAEKEVAAMEADVARVKDLAGRVGELREETRYVERVSLLLDGFRDHLVSRIGPELSREAEALFRELTNHEYEDLRVGDEDLAIEIADGGVYFPVERFSGSEVDLANLALRVAISIHLSRMSGADVGMMVLDEVLGSLDAERKDLLVQAMGRLADRFHQLFVITHAEQVKDLFPASIEVRKVGRRRSEAVLV